MNTGGTLYTSSVTCRKHFYFKTANHDSLNALKKKNTTNKPNIHNITHLLQINILLMLSVSCHESELSDLELRGPLPSRAVLLPGSGNQIQAGQDRAGQPASSGCTSLKHQTSHPLPTFKTIT